MSDYNKDQINKEVDNFKKDDQGILFKDSKDGNYFRLFEDELELVARTRDENDQNHGLKIRFKGKHNLRKHEKIIPLSWLTDDKAKIAGLLLDHGLDIDPGRKVANKLVEYISKLNPPKVQTSVCRIGWYGNYYIMPHKVYPKGSEITQQNENELFKNFAISGSFAKWQQGVRQIADDSRVVLAICAAFAGPLLRVCNMDSFIIHIYGESSNGKSTALKLAGSIYGGGGEDGFIKRWRITDSGIEGILPIYNDGFLPMDEFGQATSETIKQANYMVGNNQGKIRMNASSQLRATYTWRTVVLSSGEQTLQTKLSEIGKKPKGGMEVRFIEIPPPEQGYGIFDTLQGTSQKGYEYNFPSGHEKANYLLNIASNNYGLAIDKYLNEIAGYKQEGLKETIKASQQQFFDENLPFNSTGQVKRVLWSMALIEAAGELARSLGILPFTKQEISSAIKNCFESWLKSRGTSQGSDAKKGALQLASHLQKYGSNKYQKIDNNSAAIGDKPRLEHIGYYEEREDGYHFFIPNDQYREIISKDEEKIIDKYLYQAGHIDKDSSGKNSILRKLPGMKQARRVHHIKPSIFNEVE